MLAFVNIFGERCARAAVLHFISILGEKCANV